LRAYYISQGDQSSLSYYPYYQGFSPWISVSAILRGDTTPIDFINEQTSTISRFGRGISFGVSVWPGFDDGPVQGWCTSTRQIDRANGKLYNNTWVAAIQNKPTWIYIITFNDWNEGTIIEPSVQFGYKYLEATTFYSAKFKHQQPRYDGIPVPLAIYNATLAIRKAESQGRTVGLDDARAKLDQAKNSFDSKQYSESLTLAKQALELANKATVPLTSSTRTTTVASSSSNVIQTSLLKYEWYLLPAAVLVVGVIFMIVRRVWRTVKH